MDKQNVLTGLPDAEAFRILAESPISMVLTDPHLEDNPIVYVNRAFERVTGYNASSAVGRNCRFLQGEDTDPEDVRRIKQAIEQQTETTVDIVNYRADGTQFLNRLLLTPIYDQDGQLRHFLGIQKRLTEHEAQNSVNVSQHAIRELKHRVKNHLAMIVSMIRLQSRAVPAADTVKSLARRVESLQLLYEELSDPSAGRRTGNVSLGAYISRLANTTAHLDGRAGIRVNVDVGDATCSSEIAAKIGLVVSEIITNAFQHAFEGRDEGLLNIHLDAPAEDRVVISVEDDGVGLPEGTEYPNMGSVGGRVVAALLGDLDAELDVTSGDKGTTIRLSIPIRTYDS
ncbi:PAS domain-containing protein [Pseudoruegeria sp. HB172150]|uniref:PAS domain-containing protein n=1 Tax=Pseudoruegeria sp. HB172150 TaxID=2721164 RepID=UPI0015522850|nr:PAS domain-containing protein [Pseudoruegeria sp. HB172150]